MSDSWDDYADGWDSNEDVRLYAEEAFKSLSEIVTLQGIRVLDFGCGTGLLTEKISTQAKEIVALDSSEKMISVLKKKALHKVTAIATELSERTVQQEQVFHKKFDLVVASSVCGFLSDYESTLKVIKSMLVPGGVFVQWDWLKADESAEFGFTEKTVEAALIQAQFTDITLSQPFSLTSAQGTIPVLMASARNGA